MCGWLTGGKKFIWCVEWLVGTRYVFTLTDWWMWKQNDTAQALRLRQNGIVFLFFWLMPRFLHSIWEVWIRSLPRFYFEFILNIWKVWIWSFGQIQVEMKAHFKINLVKNRPNLICQDSKTINSLKSPIILAQKGPKKLNLIEFRERPNKRFNSFKLMIWPGGSNPYFGWLRVSFSVTQPNRVECGLGLNSGWLDLWTALSQRWAYHIITLYHLSLWPS